MSPIASPPVAGSPDRSADAAARVDGKARRQAQREKKRERDRKYQAERRAKDKVAAAADVARPEDDFNPPASSPLADVPGERDPRPAPAAEQPPVPEFLRDPKKLAAFLASTQQMLEERTRLAKRERLTRVVKALGWADEKGGPTAQCELGVSLSWQWLQAGGLDFLMALSPGLLAGVGALVLFAPAALAAYDEFLDHRLERNRAVERDRASSNVKVREMRPAAEAAS